MDLRQLECFVAVAQQLHFGRAARSLHLTQSSVSEHVRRLEQALGGMLFFRTSRRVSLTPLGEVLLPDALRALEAVGEVYSRGRQVVERGRADVRVGLAADVAHDLLASAVRVLRTRNPDVRMSPVQMRTPDQVQRLLERRLDVGLCWEAPDLDKLARVELGREAYVLLVRTDHPFAAMDTVPLTAAAREPLVMFHEERNPWTYNQAVSILSGAAGGDVHITASGDGIHGQIPHVLAGHGVAVSVTAIAAPVHQPDVVVVQLESHRGPRRFAVRHVDDSTASTLAAIDAFVDAAEMVRTSVPG